MSQTKTIKGSGQITSPWIRNNSGFWRGFGSVFNLFGGHDDDFDTATPWWVRDAEAIRLDWERVGDDFRGVLAMPMMRLHETSPQAKQKRMD